MKRSKIATGAGLLAAGALAGVAFGTAISANAASGDTPSPDGSVSAPADMFAPDPVRPDEESVGGDKAQQLETAALEAVPGGTVHRVETDAGDAAYEAHMTDADGEQVTVKFDENLSVTEVEDGMGMGDPGPMGGQTPPGPPGSDTSGE